MHWKEAMKQSELFRNFGMSTSIKAPKTTLNEDILSELLRMDAQSKNQTSDDNDLPEHKADRLREQKKLEQKKRDLMKALLNL